MASVNVGVGAQVLPGVYISPSTHIDFGHDEYVTQSQTAHVQHGTGTQAPPTLQLRTEGDNMMATTGGFPASHTTTTTTTTRVVVAPCKFDPLYIRTIPGILKIIQLVADLLGFICIMTVSHWYPSAVNWYSFVAMTGFWVTGTLLIFYLFHLIERLHMLPWLLIEFIYCAVWCLFFLIAGSVAASKAAYSEGFGAASFFGYCGMIVYGYDAFLKFRGWRAGEIAQGERIVATSTTTSPAY